MADENRMPKMQLPGNGSGDETGPNVVLKTFFQWCKTVNEVSQESKLMHEKMVSLLEQTDFSMTKVEYSAKERMEAKKKCYEYLLEVCTDKMETAKQNLPVKEADSSGKLDINNATAMIQALKTKPSLKQDQLQGFSSVNSQLQQTLEKPSTSNNVEMN